MPTCSHKGKCVRNKTKCHRIPFTPRPCVDSHQIPHFNPHTCSITCHNPKHSPDSGHCMASGNIPVTEWKHEERERITQYPDNPTQVVKTQEEEKNCCVPNVDSKPQDLPPGFKAHISVDIASDPQPLVEKPECRGGQMGIDNVCKQQTTEVTARSQQQERSSCCVKTKKSSQKGPFKLLHQGFKHSADTNPLINDSDSESLSEESIESVEHVSDKPCCASAYPLVKPEPILPKETYGTGRPDVVKDERSNMIEEKMQSANKTDGSVNCIASMAREKQKREGSCFCGVNRESHLCDARKSLTGQRSCPCRYPPGYGEFSCTGNITGICKCTGEFK